MSRAPARKKQTRLKVFAARIGFNDIYVAAPSQKAALAAWGVSANLFASGDARIVTDPAATKAALAHPGEPVRRQIDLKKIGSHAPARKLGAQRKPYVRVQAPKPAPDRSAFDNATKTLKDFEAETREAARALAEERRDLARRELQHKNGVKARRARLAKLRDAAADEYRRARDK